MYHMLKAKHGALIAIGILIMSVAGAGLLPSSCTSPELKGFIKAAVPVVVELSKAGTTWAEATGNLPPGSSVVINQGLAVITQPGSTAEKIVSLKTLGVDEALKQGVIQEGDKLLVNAGSDALVKIIEVLEKKPDAPPELPAPAPVDPPQNLLLPLPSAP